ncbi:MAG TPA: tRNA uridine-5-carboxymethylaminomethyl(34) synthesis GTPase MnmE [Verrucomicrobiota bacterium]|nr:tRNA uridine-5-carboxymethylaminomethyl(34) synthesis GTPase MnmE [Verrucomicrobiota bacterium]
MPDDTIAAISTPLGEGGLAVVRISGPAALEVADRCFVPAGPASPKPSDAPSHSVHFGHILDQGRLADEVLLTVLRAPRTYTREETVEISCHGGVLPARLVLAAVLAGGARLAEPGEFTKRAFLNGRIDLAQAEAVADLIHARTELALSAAQEQLAGKLSQRVRRLRDDLLGILAHIEAQLDFADEDIAPDRRDQLLARLDGSVAFMDALLRTADEGRILRRGVRAGIVGRPNVGKSSLLNQLLGHDRAIVSPIPGTTRDTIEETANIRGVPVVFTDTAGLRHAKDAIEQEGIRRSRETAARAEVLLHVLDWSEPLGAEDIQFLDDCEARKRILILNKSDLPRRLDLPSAVASSTPTVAVSCLTGAGIESLKDALKKLIWRGDVRPEGLDVIINARHQDALRRAREGAMRSRDALRQDLPLDVVALDLRIAVNAVGEIVGATATDDLLDVVFSQFCIGK